MSSYPKGNRNCTERRSRPRKRTFHGNQYTRSQSSVSEDESAGAKKLSHVASDNVTVNPLHCYRLIEFFTVFTGLSDILICRSCKQNVKFQETGKRGLGFKLVVNCNCGSRLINSGPLVNTGFEINRRIVFVMRLLGVGRQGLNLFCNYMDIGNGIAEETYNRIYTHIHAAAKKVYEFCCKKAVEEEKKENEKREGPILNLKAPGDETWKQREFKSLFGVTTLIGCYFEKVVDLVVPKARPAPLHPDVQKEILPMYEDSSKDDLLTRCLGGHTQNANDNFNLTFWQLAPKRLHSDLKVVEVAAFLAVALFNEGNSALLMLMNELKVVVGSQSFSYAQQMDERRVNENNKRSALETKKARKTGQEEMETQNDAFEEKEKGLLCGAGK